jgi:hypothetical protein
MVKDDEIIDCYCFQASADATFEAVLEVLVEEAAATGGFVMMFGPPELLEGLEEEAGGEPQAPARLRGPSVLPGPMWSPRR